MPHTTEITEIVRASSDFVQRGQRELARLRLESTQARAFNQAAWRLLKAACWEPPSGQSDERNDQTRDRAKKNGLARRKPEPFSETQKRHVLAILWTISSSLSRLPSGDETIARMERSILKMEALFSVKH